MPSHNCVDTSHVQSRERDARQLRDLPQRIDRNGQIRESLANHRILRSMPSHHRMDTGYVQSRECDAWQLRDLSQRFHRHR